MTLFTTNGHSDNLKVTKFHLIESIQKLQINSYIHSNMIQQVQPSNLLYRISTTKRDMRLSYHYYSHGFIVTHTETIQSMPFITDQ
jgi:hypothetical protein